MLFNYFLSLYKLFKFFRYLKLFYFIFFSSAYIAFYFVFKTISYSHPCCINESYFFNCPEKLYSYAMS